MDARVTAPDLPPGYVHRPELIERIGPVAGRRVVVLQAPAGFGKTTLLADLCRRMRERGLLVAWLTLTRDDTPDVFGAYLVHAFRRAGLDLSVPGDPDDAAHTPRHARLHTALVSQAIETRAAPCLLVLDDVERLAERETVAAVNRLMRYSPGNLCIAVAQRSNPGLDLGAAVLAGHGVSLGVEDLRFSPPEVARFFGFRIERDELRALLDRTEGWPVALQLYRNVQAGDRAAARDFRGDRGIAANFLRARLLRDLPRADYDFLLDLALFDWIDPALVDEALGTHDAQRRIAMLPSGLNGFLQPIERGSDVLRLQPFLRDYCATQRFRETPHRHRRIEGAIAGALARRNRLVPAVSHARAAGDNRLVGDVIERAGGLRLWFMEGMTRLRAIDRLLTPAILESYPRLGLLRCVVLVRRGKHLEASALFQDVGRRTQSFTRDREGGDDRRLHAERVVVHGMLAGFGCLPIGGADVLALMAEMVAVADDEDVDPALRGIADIVLSAGHYQRARFDVSRRRELAAKRHFARCGSRYGEVWYHYHAGIAAMAQGWTAAAAGHYTRGRRVAKQQFPEDDGATLIGNVLAAELDLERDRMKAVEQLAPAPEGLRDTGAWLDVYAAAYAVAAELAFVRRGAEAAVEVLAAARRHAREQGLTSIVRYLSALRVSALVAGGSVEQAAQAWRADGLPDAASEMLDLSGLQSWREMEGTASARIRLLVARGDLDPARELADRLCETAAAHGLTRTLMRGLAASLAVEQQAGAAGRAEARLVEFLARLRTTDYARPLVRERAVGAAVLRRLVETGAAGDVRETAESMLARLGDAASSAGPAFTPRELDVLGWLARDARAREIAANLGLTEDGVRYHLRNIYRKTGASGRVDALRRVRALGGLP